MKVETYEVEEVATATPEESECATALVNKLGLTGQRKYAGEATTRIPFRQMSQEEASVFRILFPTETKLTDYASGPIPLRVLEVAEKAVESGLFKKIVVWHPEDVRTDPVLVGVTPHPAYPGHHYIDGPIYLLARWGEALDEWPALVNAACKKSAGKCRAILARVEADLKTCEAGVIPTDGMGTSFNPQYNR